ncbi:putative serine/threonine-protein kinase dyrk1 [Porphyridium purpureum]|uniref:Putative serine/threonine-protein kinase dyrk1 n=1 Tax=Porphyridium purpureum TaxID=35688 RepID=A0A5J4YZI5_PORPP|nr:putative serine/threonine-protein kinase dyrk1 [Porphyridium purpureum]|eukprot:POR6405..scf208_2
MFRAKTLFQKRPADKAGGDKSQHGKDDWKSKSSADAARQSGMPSAEHSHAQSPAVETASPGNWGRVHSTDAVLRDPSRSARPAHESMPVNPSRLSTDSRTDQGMILRDPARESSSSQSSKVATRVQSHDTEAVSVVSNPLNELGELLKSSTNKAFRIQQSAADVDMSRGMKRVNSVAASSTSDASTLEVRAKLDAFALELDAQLENDEEFDVNSVSSGGNSCEEPTPLPRLHSLAPRALSTAAAIPSQISGGTKFLRASGGSFENHKKHKNEWLRISSEQGKPQQDNEEQHELDGGSASVLSRKEKHDRSSQFYAVRFNTDVEGSTDKRPFSANNSNGGWQRQKASNVGDLLPLPKHLAAPLRAIANMKNELISEPHDPNHSEDRERSNSYSGAAQGEHEDGSRSVPNLMRSSSRKHREDESEALIEHMCPTPTCKYSQARYDDAESDYFYYGGEWFAKRYVLLQLIGRGTFGHVLKAWDTIERKFVAVKIIKSQKAFFDATVQELAVLSILMREDPHDEHHIMRMSDCFIYRGHQVIVSEVLAGSLYDWIAQQEFRGIELKLVIEIGKSILECLKFLHSPGINLVHCDLKPENILLRTGSPFDVSIKVIDFGSACRVGQAPQDYIQSRFYRAPEVILGCGFNTKIDIWSAGCIMIELLTGEPLFPGRSEAEQLALIADRFHGIPESMILGGKKAPVFFEKDASGEFRMKSEVQALTDGNAESTTPIMVLVANRLQAKGRGAVLKNPLFDQFATLVSKLLCVVPKMRWTAAEALEHDLFHAEKLTPQDFLSKDESRPFAEAPSVASSFRVGGFDKEEGRSKNPFQSSDDFNALWLQSLNRRKKRDKVGHSENRSSDIFMADPNERCVAPIVDDWSRRMNIEPPAWRSPAVGKPMAEQPPSPGGVVGLAAFHSKRHGLSFDARAKYSSVFGLRVTVKTKRKFNFHTAPGQMSMKAVAEETHQNPENFLLDDLPEVDVSI